MKRYTDDELLEMSEDKLNKLAEAEEIDDDDWMRWHVVRDEIEMMADQFLRDIKAITKEHPMF